MVKIAITCFLSKSDTGKSIRLCEVKWAAELPWGEQLRILDSRLVLKCDVEGKKRMLTQGVKTLETSSDQNVPGSGRTRLDLREV